MDNQDQAAQLAALLAKFEGMTATASPMAPQNQSVTPVAAGWAKPAPQPTPMDVLGVSIPISVETNAGKLRVYLNFPGSAAASPQALTSLIEQLAAAGLPLDTWQGGQRGGGSWGGGNGGSSWGGGNNYSGRSNWRR